MKESLAKVIFWVFLVFFAFSSILMWKGIELFKTYYYILVWWSYLFIVDSWLYWKGEGSLFLKNPIDFITFLVPFSAFFWFIFEAFNLRLNNWNYVDVPLSLWIRWSGNFLAFGTVLPALFLTANFLDCKGVFRKNEFSVFFATPIPKFWMELSIGLGCAMILLPLLYPHHFFPLVWGGIFLIFDPLNALWGKRSLINEWRQGNWNRTLQLLVAGTICGFLWEFWNFWAGAKWVYTFSLPEWAHPELRLFEMPLLGFLGFPPFALECFAVTEFVRTLREKLSLRNWRVLCFLGFLFSLFICYWMDRAIVLSYQ